ncbi:hypothetical protein E2C01_008266 [Portunus trituberculatus]|uniref:Uncharacterized protein n=1 Tax=Portunus trituberculatus TaxID=210409 RepID=A0A5B7D3H5_PORTR|nr:hypothetical protein [Portunus trituberculatus]
MVMGCLYLRWWVRTADDGGEHRLTEAASLPLGPSRIENGLSVKEFLYHTKHIAKEKAYHNH